MGEMSGFVRAWCLCLFHAMALASARLSHPFGLVRVVAVVP
jgi:hypothetical protein